MVKRALVIAHNGSHAHTELDKILAAHVDTLIEDMSKQRNRLPYEDDALSAIDSVLVPLLQLHRVVAASQPIEEQLERSELDLLTYGVSSVDLYNTAGELGHTHLGKIQLDDMPGLPMKKGLIVGPKSRILVPRVLQIKQQVRCVVFFVDIGSPWTCVCHETLRGFGIDPDQLVREKKVRAKLASDGGNMFPFELVILSPEGNHNDLNVLGMDYLMKCGGELRVVPDMLEVQLATAK